MCSVDLTAPKEGEREFGENREWGLKRQTHPLTSTTLNAKVRGHLLFSWGENYYRTSPALAALIQWKSNNQQNMFILYTPVHTLSAQGTSKITVLGLEDLSTIANTFSQIPVLRGR